MALKSLPKFLKCLPFFFFSMILAVAVLVPPCIALQPLDDAEMSDIYAAQGFSRFSINDLGGGSKEMEVWLNIRTEQYTEIDELKMGWNDRAYKTGPPDPNFKWDQDWSNVKIGSESQYFTTEGFFFKVVFDDFDDPARRLKSMTIGVGHAEGEIHAEFNSFTGSIGPIYDRVANLDLGQGTIYADGKFELSIVLEDNRGWFLMNFENSSYVPD